MSFFVLDKDVTTGSLRLPIGGAFDTREDALGALSAAVSAGQATVSGQVYVVDLDTALPVLVMPTPVAAAASPVEAPLEVEVAPDEDSLASGDTPLEPEPEIEPEVESEPEVEQTLEAEEQPEAAEPDTTPAPATVVAGALAGGSLADALKRAANSLEDEGIIAPESINAEDFSFEDDLAVDVAAGESAEVPVGDQIDEVVSAVGVVEPMSAIVEEPAEVLEAPADWPWANVEAFRETPTLESDEAELEMETPEALPGAAQIDEPDTLITSAPPLGEDAYVPRPVILGDYADLASDEAADVPAADEPAVAQDEDAAGDTPNDESPFDVPVAEVVVTEPEPVAEMAYEPTGELDLSTYTCNDCVYSNTCPKVGEVTPAECGTFQWRSS
ncbi:MAG: hypothetical protein ACYC2X_07265 [Coriobacteriia bacterium]